MINGFAKLVEAASTSELALAAFLSIAVAAICYKFFKNARDIVKFAAFAAVLIFAFQLSIRLIVKPPTNEHPELNPSDMANLITLIGSFPPQERMDKCLLVEGKSTCEPLVRSISNLAMATASPAVQKEVTQALAKGKTDLPSLIKKINSDNPMSDRVLTIGKSNGWDIDIFWCQTFKELNNYNSANGIAKLIASMKRFGRYDIGRVRLRTLDSQKFPATEQRPLAIIADSDESESAEALSEILTRNGIDIQIYPNKSLEKSPWYLSISVCN